MASINWVNVSSGTREPVNLPNEKFLLKTSQIDVYLSPAKPGQPLVAKSSVGQPGESKSLGGDVYLSNLRVVFVSSEKASTLPPLSGTIITTLSIPYASLVDSRLIQPFFGSNYFEALVLPAPDGGLQSPHNVRINFNEGGSFQFNEMVIEMKERAAESTQRAAAAVESLPLYSPPPTSDTPASPLIDHPLPSAEDLNIASECQRLDRLESEENGPSAPPPPHTDSPPAYK